MKKHFSYITNQAIIVALILSPGFMQADEAENVINMINIKIGYQALHKNHTGILNTAVGFQALANSTNSNNIALGTEAGSNLTTGSSDIYIGNSGNATESNIIRIGTQGTCAGQQNRCFLAGIAASPVSGHPVAITPAGKLGMLPSSILEKFDIAPMGDYSSGLMTLPTYIFRYTPDLDPTATLQLGFMAEDFVTSDTLTVLIVDDDAGNPCYIQYFEVIAMLVNELQKVSARLTALGG